MTLCCFSTTLGSPTPLISRIKDRKLAEVTLQVESFVNYIRRQKEGFQYLILVKSNQWSIINSTLIAALLVEREFRFCVTILSSSQCLSNMTPSGSVPTADTNMGFKPRRARHSVGKNGKYFVCD